MFYLLFNVVGIVRGCHYHTIVKHKIFDKEVLDKTDATNSLEHMKASLSVRCLKLLFISTSYLFYFTKFLLNLIY